MIHSYELIDKYIISSVTDVPLPPVVTPPTGPLHPDVRWPTPGGIDEEKAREICEGPIKKSPLFELCGLRARDSFEMITESCMIDLQVRPLIGTLVNNLLLEMMRQTHIQNQTYKNNEQVTNEFLCKTALCVRS